MEYMLLVASAIFFSAICLTLDRHNLPSIALVFYAVFPLGYSNAPAASTVLTPSGLVMLVWFFRGILDRESRTVLPVGSSQIKAGVFFLFTFSAWLIVKTIDSESLGRATAWTGAFFLLVLIPTLTRMDRETVSRLKTTWVVCGAVLAIYGLAEFFLANNYIYGPLYEKAPFPIEQYWSTYRITTSLGHPLWNSIFFSVSAAIAIGRFAEVGRLRWLMLGAVCALGIFLTVSRGGVIALAAAIGVIVLAHIAIRVTVIQEPVLQATPKRSPQFATSGRARALVVAMLAVLGIAAIVNSSIFQQRISSANGIASSTARTELISIALDMSERYHHLGSGAGNSNFSISGSANAVVIENSFLQLLVSLGIPGVLLFSALLISAIATAMKARSLAVTGGLVAYCVAAAGFNWIEANRAGLLLLGLLVSMAWSEAVTNSRGNLSLGGGVVSSMPSGNSD